MQDTPPHPLTDIQRAARFFYLQQHAFGGRVDGQTFGTATTAPALNLLRIEENLSAAHLRLNGVYVEHLPWLDVLKKYDRTHTLFYLDPPYWETEGYGVDFPFENYLAMADFMRSCKGKVIVSINDHPQIRETFSGFWQEGLDLKYSVANGRDLAERSSFGELVIANFEPMVMGGLF
ncbi:DNA adenine methylase [Andreprevotia chitinilytica]|uniref:DNA adenine methylase n=1 Tax=Andreprevotia chitinilytica TaxID=396808 RepID=UPI000A4F71A2|nr:hypothetical protein [Andreprevotia chitinilytica]